MNPFFNVVPTTVINTNLGMRKITIKGLTTRDLTAFDSQRQGEIFEEMLNANIPNRETSLYSISMTYPGMRKPMTMGFRKYEQNNGKAIVEKLAAAHQSNEDVQPNEKLQFDITVIENVSGPKLDSKGVIFKRPNGLQGLRVPYVKNFNDSLCLPRAVAIAFAHGGMVSLLHDHNVSSKKQLPSSAQSTFTARKNHFNRLTDDKDPLVDEKQKIYAMDLLTKCGIPLDKPSYNEEDLKIIYEKHKTYEEHNSLPYPPFSLHVFDFEGQLQYSFQDEDNYKNQIPLLFLHYQKHMDFAKDLRHAKKQFCHLCRLAYPLDRRHYCQKRCFLCNDHIGECQAVEGEGRRCSKCHFYFKNAECFAAHLKTSPHSPNPKANLCTQRHRCEKCNKSYHVDKANPHDCLKTYCGKCKEKREYGHVCTWKDISETERKRLKASCEKFKYILFDFETMQNKIDENDQIEFLADGHVPIWVGAISVCQDCEEQDIKEPCKTCGGERVFERIYDKLLPKSYVMDEFVRHFFCSPRYDGYTMFAHNSSGFDSIPIMQKLLSMGVAPKALLQGTRIFQMTISPDNFKTSMAMDNAQEQGTNAALVQNPIKATVTVKDTWLFTQCPLSSFSKTFDLETRKGEFPYLLISDKYWDMKMDHLPDKKWYEPELKKPEASKNFNEWYEANKSKPFDLIQELRDYGMNDVQLLLKGFLKLRKIFIEYCHFDPFSTCITLASTAQLAFRLNHLKNPKLIAHLDERGVPLSDNQSMFALRYLLWWEKKRNEERAKLGLPPLKMQTAIEGEKKIIIEGEGGKQTKIDGWWQEEEEDGKGIGFEVQGCHWHGCPHCNVSLTSEKDIIDAEMRLYETRKKISELERMGLEIHQVWEHEIREQLKNDKEMKEFFKENSPKERLFPRDAYYGGRTFTSQLLTECDDDDEAGLGMGDFISLYPSVMLQERYPVGSPDYIKKYALFGRHIPIPPPKTPLSYRGFILCKLLVDRDCEFSVIPYKINGQLYFGNCAACIRTESAGPCRHTDQEREFFRVWTHVDLNNAIMKGARVTDILEVWDWKEWSEPGELFGDFVRTFYRMKVTNSGWGSKNTPESRKQFLQGLQDRDGIELKEEDIKENRALRFLAKIMLNSMYGKFGERVHRHNTVYLKDRNKILEIVQDPRLKVDSHKWIPSCYKQEDERDEHSTIMLTYHTREEFEHSTKFSNLALACFITAYGRQRLHQACEAVGDAHLYSDTDSIAYKKTPKAEAALKSFFHPYLGGLESEVEPGWKMTKFTAPSPKCYGYRLVKRGDPSTQKETVKIRGIMLHQEATEQYNLDGLTSSTQSYVNALRAEAQIVLKTDSLEERRLMKPVTTSGFQAQKFRQRQFNRRDNSVITNENIKNLRIFQHKGILDLYNTRVRPFGFVPSSKRSLPIEAGPNSKESHTEPAPEFDPLLFEFMF